MGGCGCGDYQRGNKSVATTHHNSIPLQSMSAWWAWSRSKPISQSISILLRVAMSSGGMLRGASPAAEAAARCGGGPRKGMARFQRPPPRPTMRGGPPRCQPAAAAAGNGGAPRPRIPAMGPGQRGPMPANPPRCAHGGRKGMAAAPRAMTCGAAATPAPLLAGCPVSSAFFFVPTVTQSLLLPTSTSRTGTRKMASSGAYLSTICTLVGSSVGEQRIMSRGRGRGVREGS